jgi:cell division transport system permease protein
MKKGEAMHNVFSRPASIYSNGRFRSLGILFIMSVTFMAFAVLMMVVYTSSQIATYLSQKPEVIGFFKDSVTESEITDLKKNIEINSFVFEVKYVSKDDAMKSFLEENKDKKDLIASVTSNPFPAHINVKADSLANIDKVADLLKAKGDMFEKIDDSHEFLSKLTSIVRGIQIITLGILVVFILCTAFVVMLSMALNVYAQKSEIVIMKLVGATNWYVISPFIVLNMILATASAILSFLVVGSVVFYYYPKFIEVLVGNISQINMNLQILGIGFMILLVFGWLLSFTVSFLAAKRYIR